MKSLYIYIYIYVCIYIYIYELVPQRTALKFDKRIFRERERENERECV